MGLESNVQSLVRKIRLNNNLEVDPTNIYSIPTNKVWTYYCSIEGHLPAELIAGPQVYSSKKDDYSTSLLIILDKSPSDREMKMLPMEYEELPISYLCPTDGIRLAIKQLNKKRH